MKSKIYNIIGAMLLSLALTSCHNDSDVLLSYDHNDILAFDDAVNSFAGKFKVTWNGLNQYYALWDYEEKHGLDWDATYDEYLPKFIALDERDKATNPVTNRELKTLMEEFLSPLHDGHLVIDWKNHHTGKSVRVAPSELREKSRDDYAEYATHDFGFYLNTDNGQIMTDVNGYPIAAQYSTIVSDIIEKVQTEENIGCDWLKKKILEYEEKLLPTEKEVFLYKGMTQLYSELSKDELEVEQYNKLVTQYAYLEVPGLEFVDPDFDEYGVAIRSAILKGNTGGIAYLYFDSFTLTPYLKEPSEIDVSNPVTAAHVENVKKVWHLWFDNIQEMHKNGTLDGVIIDVRENPGGMVSDSPYILGALMPSGDFQYAWQRVKRGTGRYDYSPLMPQYFYTMEEEHEVINDKPIVVLINRGSISMSETTALTAQCLKNGTVIGRRSHGGMCFLAGNDYNTVNYAGKIGENGQTPVFGYVPFQVVLDIDKNIREGVGVIPDIEVAQDMMLDEEIEHEDTQLDRAIEFIVTGK